ncbi:GldG family protein, partial [Ancylomarina sp. DW003]
IKEVNLTKQIDKEVDILVLGEPKLNYSEKKLKILNDYIDRGGNLIIAADRNRQDVMNPLVERFGVEFMNGQVVEYNKGYLQDLVTAEFTPLGKKIAYQFERFAK